jgi:nitrilase
MVVAAVQATPVFLDRERTVAKAVSLVGEAAAHGVGLIVFPEVFVPGYPDWVWRTTPWAGASSALYAGLLEQSVTIPGPSVQALGGAARGAGAFVVMGVNERDPNGSTVYNSLLYLGPHGEVLGVHRKLMPTGGERLVWGSGDGSGLVTVDTPLGRVGGLIWWENYMPLARAAMYAKGVDIHLAPTWDNSDVWVATLRHIAKEPLLRRRHEQRPAGQRRAGGRARCDGALRRRRRLDEPRQRLHRRPVRARAGGPAQRGGGRPLRRGRSGAGAAVTPPVRRLRALRP